MDNYGSYSNYWNEMDGIGVVLMGAVHSDNDRVGDDETLYKNQEGYRDPTAGKAMAQINADIADRNHKLNQVFRDIAEIAGFEIVGRVTLKHKKSGKIFR